MVTAGSKVRRMEKRNTIRKAEKEVKKTALKDGNKKIDRNIFNRKCSFATVEEEIEDRYETAAETLKVYKRYLPGILKDLSEMEDPRNPKKVGHKLSLLMLYGIFMFVFHMSSRREANSGMTMTFLENMRAFFPELEDLPHSVTLARLLEVIDAEHIEEAMVNLVNRLIRDKKFLDYMVGKQYVIAVDGTQKWSRGWEWSKNSLKRRVKCQDEETYQYYAYALEASFVLPGGLTIPFMTEFLDREAYKDEGAETEKRKQDCEYKAFKRLAERLKRYFPQLKITLTVDGLYAKGPIMEICCKYRWDYMVVLKDGSLKTVWENIEGIKKTGLIGRYEPPVRVDGKVKQEFWWVNGIDYRYGDNGCKSIKVNVVVCEEIWTETDCKTRQEVEKRKKFAWISFKEINPKNVEKRCNKMGRPRWNIETQNLIEKHHGYAYEHCFSYDWNAMKAFHYLMHIGHVINILTLYSTALIGKVKEKGVRGTIKHLWLIFNGSSLDLDKLESLIQSKYQLRMAI